MDESRINSIFRNLNFFGNLEKPNYTTKVIDYNTYDILYLEVNVSEMDIITDIRYRIVNKPIVYAICELLTAYSIKKDIKFVGKTLTKEKLYNEIGEFDDEYLYVLELYKVAIQNISEQVTANRKDSSIKIKRFLKFNEEDDDLDTLSDNQIKKLLNAVDNLGNGKDAKKREDFEKIKESVIGINSRQRVALNQKKSLNQKEESSLLDDDIPDFSSYEDITKELSFENKEFEDMKFSEDLNFDNTGLDFSNYNFDDKDDGENEKNK